MVFAYGRCLLTGGVGKWRFNCSFIAKDCTETITFLLMSVSKGDKDENGLKLETICSPFENCFEFFLLVSHERLVCE